MSAQKQTRVNSTWFILYILLLTAHIGLVWVLPYFPTQDGPSHIYNLVILDDLLHGGKEWGEFFTYKLHAVPNLGFHLIAYPLLQLFPPLITEKIFITIHILLMGACVPFFLRSFDKPVFPLSFLVFPVIFNFNLMMGFYSYTIAIPLFLLAVSISWKFRDCSIHCKFVMTNLMGFVLYYFHLIPFIFFLLFLGLMGLLDADTLKERFTHFLKTITITSPLILNLFMYLTNGNTSQDYSYQLSPSRFFELSSELFMFSTPSFSPWQLIPAAILMFLMYLLLKETIIKSGSATVSERLLFSMVLTMLIIYFFAPFSFGGGSFFNERFPWVIFLILLPLLHAPETGISRHISMIVVASVFLMVNSIIFWQQNAIIKSFVSGLHVEIPKRAFVMTYKAKTPQWSRVDPLMHAISYYCISNKYVDIGNYETQLDYFPIRFQKDLPSFPFPEQIVFNPETIKWPNHPSIQYIFGWNVTKKDKEKLDVFFLNVWGNGLLTIWERERVSLPLVRPDLN